MRQLIRFIADEELPASSGWVVVHIEDTYYLFVKRTRATPAVMAEAQAACDHMVRESKRRSA